MTRNSRVLASFVEYCKKHPDERFWQALRNWSQYNFIFASKGSGFHDQVRRDFYDTFNWEGRRHESLFE